MRNSKGIKVFHYFNFQSSWQSSMQQSPSLHKLALKENPQNRELGAPVSELHFIPPSLQYILPSNAASGQQGKLASAPKVENHLSVNWFPDIRCHLIWMLYFSVLMQYHTYWQAALLRDRLGQALRLWPALPQTKQPLSLFSQLCFSRVQHLQLLQWNQAAK